jgi:hypothetical protein
LTSALPLLGQLLGFNLPHRGYRKRFLVVVHRRPRRVTALDKHLNRAIGQLEQLQDIGDGADLIQIVDTGASSDALRCATSSTCLLSSMACFERFDRTLTTHKKWQHHVGVHHNVAKGNRGSWWS